MKESKENATQGVLFICLVPLTLTSKRKMGPLSTNRTRNLSKLKALSPVTDTAHHIDERTGNVQESSGLSKQAWDRHSASQALQNLMPCPKSEVFPPRRARKWNSSSYECAFQKRYYTVLWFSSHKQKKIKNLQNLSLKKWKDSFVSILHLYAFLAPCVLFVLFWKKGGSISFSFVGGKPPQAKEFTRYLNWYPHLNYIKPCKSFHNATWKCMLKAYANICRAVGFAHLKQNIMALTAGHV